MTPDEERALLDAAVAGVDDAVREAFDEMIALIRAGTPPRDAVQQVMQTFTGELAETMAAALSALIGASVGATDVLAFEVGAVSLSRHLYAEAASTSDAVAGLVQRHLAGFADARRLALELFDGYAFRAPDAEPLQFNTREPRLPRYLRDALVPDQRMADGLQRAFARIQVDGLSTGALRAAYSELLDALDALEDGEGEALLERRLQVAFYERMRYFATRIARTEMHRAYMEREARILMEDTDLEFVQVRRAPGRQEPCICVLFTGRDMYGMGPGVYPKAEAPRPPFHPFCMCVVSPRLDLTGRAAEPRDPDADAYFLGRLDGPLAARVMGSRAKRDAVLFGATAEDVANAGRDTLYRIGRVGG